MTAVYTDDPALVPGCRDCLELVAEGLDDAKRDAVRTLESFGCCEDSPFRKAFRTVVEWMVDEA